EQGIATGCNIRRGIVGVLHIPLHVRLAAGQPDFSHQNVLQSDGIVALNGHLEGPACLERLKYYLPAAVFRGRRNRLALKFDLYLLPGSGVTPNRHRDLLLQDGVIGEQTVGLYFRGKGTDEGSYYKGK